MVRIMAASTYIPAGRTSIIKRRDITLQVQTEYAHRPLPRITTTILDGGKVVHKIERGLDKPIDSLARQEKVEEAVKRQHTEVLAIIRNESSGIPLSVGLPSRPQRRPVTLYDELCAISGVQHVFRLDNEGNFVGGSTSDQFKRSFAEVFKNIRQLIEVFVLEPGVGVTREKGVCEIERSRLYLASAGAECYFILVKPVDFTMDYEKAIKHVIDPDPFRPRSV